ncbi:MAG: hypothetical protein IJ240_03070 [Clostridia bacterium]|nr:hypothetical protein [Clostridia bacterium]
MKNERLYACAALLMLLLPLALAPFGIDLPNYRAEGNTQRFAEAPASWLEERLALRCALLTLRGETLYAMGDAGPQAVVGEGCAYYRPALIGLTDPMMDETADEMTQAVVGLRDALRAQGQALIVLIAPDKASVYPDGLPARLRGRAGSGDGEKAASRLALAGVDVVYAKDALRAARTKGDTYFAYDTHWNARGAMIAANAALDALGLPLYEPDEIVLTPGRASDIRLLYAPGHAPEEPDAEPDIGRGYRLVRPMRSLNDMTIRTANEDGQETVLMARDSFGAGLFPYLANRLRSFVMSRSYQNLPVQAAREGAETVILEIAERNLRSLPELLANPDQT